MKGSADVRLILGSHEISGWDEIRITRGIERLPTDFDFRFTDPALIPDERYMPKPGDPVKVTLGTDQVTAGYVDRVIGIMDVRNHMFRVTGRSKCADLVDCAAEWPGGQISGASVYSVAQTLCEPYGAATHPDIDPYNPLASNPPANFQRKIDVNLGADHYVGAPVQQFNLNLGETPYEIIERLARNSGMLVYDDEWGNLVLSRFLPSNFQYAASGFKEGANIERAMFTWSEDQRYSEYLAFQQSINVLKDIGGTANLIASYQDPTIRRRRQKAIIAEAGDPDFLYTKHRAQWEGQRRFGRSFQLTLTTDSWRDKDGVLWTPNTIASVEIPKLNLAENKWLIAEVTYRLSQYSGTTADIVLMPPEGFIPQPTLLNPIGRDILNPNAPAPTVPYLWPTWETR